MRLRRSGTQGEMFPAAGKKAGKMKKSAAPFLTSL
jgi:hypothetical protein